MNSIALLGSRVAKRLSCMLVYSRKLCEYSVGGGDEIDVGLNSIEEQMSKEWKILDFDATEGEKPGFSDHGSSVEGNFRSRWSFVENVKFDADRILSVLQRDGPGFDSKSALSELGIRVTGALEREVLLRIFISIDCSDKTRSAKLAYKFFVWCGQQESFRHTTNSYHLIMKIFADCEEYKAMWRLADEMVEKGFPTTGRTFNILICTCGEAGLAKKVVERFVKSKTFNFRPFKHSYNAILYSLLVIKQYRLIEWVYQQMSDEGFSSDVLTYNIILCAKYRMGKLDHFHRLLDEMGMNGFSPDIHTYNILLHVLGKGDKPLAALNLLNHMTEVGFDPSTLHFTNLMDGLSRAGNLDACKYFFDEMIRKGCMPDVVSYTVMITSYIVAGELENALVLFNEMFNNGHLPNVFTYNSMIRGFCMAGRFDEACAMLKEMETRGCSPNFLVYNTLVSNLRNAGKLSEAHEVIRHMVEQGKYAHLVSKFRRYKRC